MFWDWTASTTLKNKIYKKQNQDMWLFQELLEICLTFLFFAELDKMIGGF